MDISNKPTLNYEITFTVYNKKKMDNFIYPSKQSKKEVFNILETLLNVVDNYEPNLEGDYNMYYSKYVQYLDYKEFAIAKRSDAEAYLQKTKELILKQNDLKNIDFSSLDHYYLVYSTSHIFKRDWLFGPILGFSNELINDVLKDEHELLFEFYFYENHDTLHQLPFTKNFDGPETEVILPHSIDEKAARRLLSVLEKYKRSDNDFLNQEVELLKELIYQVVNGEIILSLLSFR